MSFTSMHNDYLDPDRHCQEEPPEWYLDGTKTVFDFFSVDSDSLTQSQCETMCKKYIYKYTDCGAWIEFYDWGIRLGSIVEGSDEGTQSYDMLYRKGFTSADIQARIDAIEDEAAAIWRWCNEENENGQTDAELGLDFPDVAFDYRHLL